MRFTESNYANISKHISVGGTESGLIVLVRACVSIALTAWVLWAKFKAYKYLKLQRQQMNSQNIAMY